MITAVHRDFIKIQVEFAPQVTCPLDPQPVDMDT